MKAHLTRCYMFSASHRLHSDAMSEAENAATYGKCNNTGMVCNLVDLDGFVQREILQRFDLENLNTQAEFAQTVPTTENLCTAIYDILQRGFTLAHLEKVRIEETMMNSFEYAGASEISP
jgi:6-pyruvoyltetrahydropterin/6-carboxytetrahydropterin synthase